MPLESSQARWFASAVQPHGPALRAYLRATFPALTDVDDLLQETYRRILQRYAEEPERLTEVRALLFTTARNLAIDLLRRRNVVTFEALPDNDADFPPDDCTLHAGEILSRQQELELLSLALEALPERCRQVLTLRKIYGLSQREIAAQLGISEHTVEAHVQAGLRRCTEFFARLDQPTGHP